MTRNIFNQARKLLDDPTIPQLASTSELSALLGAHKNTIYHWVQENRILVGRVNAKLFLFDVRQVLTAIVKTNPLRRSICKNPLCVSLLKNQTKTKG